MSRLSYIKLTTCLSIFLILCLQTLAQAQNKPNPFDIRPRLAETSGQDTAQSLPNQNNVLPSTDTTMRFNDTSSISSDINAPNLPKENPFEVDHLPLRKTNLSKKTEELKSISESTKSSTRFLFFFLILGCALLAIVLNTSSRSLTLISKSLVNENMLKLFYREENIKPSAALYILYVIFFINMSVFIYLVSNKYGGPSGIVAYSIIFGLVMVIYLLRHAGLMFLGKVFPISKNTDIYSFTIMIFNHFIGLVLIPVNFLIAFGPVNLLQPILYGALVFIGLIILLRVFRGFFIVSEYFGDRLFQIIIYLCAFEIAPVLILLKTVMNSLD